MRYLRDISLAYKVVIVTGILAGVFLTIAFAAATYRVRARLVDTTTRSVSIQLMNEKRSIDALAQQVRNTLLAVGKMPPFQGVVRARASGGYDSEETSSESQWKYRMAATFVAQMESTGLYDQLRYIDNDGYEVVRVDFVDGKARRVPDSALQNKAKRDYFIEANKIGPGEVYVSASELNREGNPPRISVPHRPVIRYATAIFDERTGERAGIFIANVLVDKLIEKTDLLNTENGSIYIINSKGAFIHHPDVSKEWGGEKDLATGHSFESEFPGSARRIQGSEGSFTDGEYHVTFTKAEPDPEDPSRTWLIVHRAPLDQLLAPVNMIVRNAIILGLTVFLFLFFSIGISMRRILRPLQSLSDAAERFGEGMFDAELPVAGKDEIGRVAIAFNTMAGRLKTLYASLEDQVKEKTKNLAEKVDQLQKGQLAMTNVLEDIAAERDKSETILRSIGDAVFVVDRDRHVLVFNEVCAQLCGYTAKEAIGRPYHEVLSFVHEEDGSANTAFIENVFKTGGKQEMGDNTLLVTRDGRRIPVADSASPLKDSDGQVLGVVVVFRDVSKERSIDRAKTEFVSLASHQLRTPLTAISWYTEMLLSGDAGRVTKSQRAYLDEIYQGNKRMVDLVNSLLNVSRLELGTFVAEPEMADIAKMSRSVVEEASPSIQEKDIHVVETYEPSLPQVNVDVKLMRMVLQNLVSNAVKYTPRGGRVEVSIRVAKKGSLVNAIACTSDMLHISVSDTGYGIPKAQQDKIFTKLFRADNVQKLDVDGTGLGLYIVRSVVEQSGGSITFTSEEGKGTTFSVLLPLSGMHSKKAGTAQAAPPTGTVSPKPRL